MIIFIHSTMHHVGEFLQVKIRNSHNLLIFQHSRAVGNFLQLQDSPEA